MRIPFLGGIGVPELIIILVVVLIIFGPKNLPKLGNAIGKTFKSLRDGMEGKKKDDASAKAADAPSDDADAQSAPVKEVAAKVDSSDTADATAQGDSEEKPEAEKTAQ